MRLRTLIPLCLLILAAPGSTVCQTVPAGSFRVGAAKVDITPDANELPKSYLGVLDHVYSRAIVIDNGKTSAALITLDAGVVPTDFVEDRERSDRERAWHPFGECLDYRHAQPQRTGSVPNVRSAGRQRRTR